MTAPESLTVRHMIRASRLASAPCVPLSRDPIPKARSLTRNPPSRPATQGDAA